MRLGEKERVRALFERVTEGGSANKLKSKKAKFFYKKWLDYEDKVGDEKSRERVKAKAAEYVRSQTGGNATATISRKEYDDDK